MLKLSKKQIDRRQWFLKHGPSKIGDPDVSDYTTGKPSHFIICNGPSDDEQKPWDKIHGGPIHKTPQWRRTAK